MIDAPTYARLLTLIRRESRTLLQYVVEAFPWTTVRDQQGVTTLQTLAREEADAAAGIARLLVRQHLTPPALGAYPSHFTRFNFLDLGRLVPLLHQQQLEGIAVLEADLRSIKGAAVKEPLESLLAVKQRHLTELQALLPVEPGTPTP